MRIVSPLAPSLQPFGAKMILLAITPRGRLYLDTWRAHEASPFPYTLTGRGSTTQLSRDAAAAELRNGKVLRMNFLEGARETARLVDLALANVGGSVA